MMLLYRLAKWMEQQNAQTADRGMKVVQPSHPAGGQKIATRMADDSTADTLATETIAAEDFVMMKQAVEQFQETVPHADGKIN